MNPDVNQFQWQPFGPVAHNYLYNSMCWINIAVGSIRSGKTIVALTRFIEYTLTSGNTDFMIIGKTLSTLERNVVRPFMKMLNTLGIPAEHNRYLNEIYYEGNTVCLFGVGKKGDDEKIQGSTFGGTLIDEGTVITEDGYKMILSRNSLPGSMIFITCNPANPNHYLYNEYIKNEDMIQEGRCKVWTFTLDDNTTLTKEYVENLKASYPPDSLFYKRYIDGLWVSGQGAIYGHFDDNNIYHEDKPLDYYDYLEFGSDYGASSTTCWNLIGIKCFKDHYEYDVIDEGGHNADTTGVNLTDSQIVEMVADQQDQYGLGAGNTFYPSHDATSFEAELNHNRRIRMNVEKYMPDTLECIGVISDLIYKNYFHVHSRCTRTIDCIRSYEWDASAARRGEDRPDKVDDHFCDSLRAPVMRHRFDDGHQLLGGLVYL